MYYKIVKGTDSFEKFSSIKAKMKLCMDAAWKLVEELGATAFAPKSFVAFGGVSRMAFPEKPKGWNKDSEKGVYYPSVNNKVDQAKLDSVPTLSHKELNDVTGFKQQSKPNPRGHGQLTTFCLGFQYGKDGSFLFDSQDFKYTPPKDFVEILGSEYKSLLQK